MKTISNFDFEKTLLYLGEYIRLMKGKTAGVKDANKVRIAMQMLNRLKRKK